MRSYSPFNSTALSSQGKTKYLSYLKSNFKFLTRVIREIEKNHSRDSLTLEFRHSKILHPFCSYTSKSDIFHYFFSLTETRKSTYKLFNLCFHKNIHLSKYAFRSIREIHQNRNEKTIHSCRKGSAPITPPILV